MGFKCAPQILGLTRGSPKNDSGKKQKHRADGRAIAGELGRFKSESHERLTNSDTYDASRSYLNKYTMYENGFEAWDAIVNRANEYRSVGKTKDGKEYTRSLRQDAVVGFAVIINPPSDVCAHWSDEEYGKFYLDSLECLAEIEPRIFATKNIVMQAEHFDEGASSNDRHIHILGECKDQEGHYCGNIIDAKLLATINKIFPNMMRERGWDLDDLDTTDWNRMKSDEAYRTERKRRRKTQGQSVNKYLEVKAKQAGKDIDENLKASEVLLSQIQLREQEFEKEIEEQRKQIEEDRVAIRKAIALLDSISPSDWESFLKRYRTKEGGVSLYDRLQPAFQQWKTKQEKNKDAIIQLIEKGEMMNMKVEENNTEGRQRYDY